MATVGGEACVGSCVLPSCTQCSTLQLFSVFEDLVQNVPHQWKVFPLLPSPGTAGPGSSCFCQCRDSPRVKATATSSCSHPRRQQRAFASLRLVFGWRDLWLDCVLESKSASLWGVLQVSDPRSTFPRAMSGSQCGGPQCCCTAFLLLVEVEVKLRIRQSEDAVSRQGFLLETWIRTLPPPREQELEHPGCLLGSALGCAL